MNKMNDRETRIETNQDRKTKDIITDIKKQLTPCGKLISELFNKSRAIWNCIFMALIVNFVVEVLCRQSFYECFTYIHNHTMSFLYNTLIVLGTLCIGLILKRRYFYYSIICTFWLGLGVTSAIILCYRQTPLTAGDFLIARSAVGLFDKYLSGTQMMLTGVVVFVVISTLVLILLRAPKPTDLKFKKGISFIAVVVAMLASSTYFANNVAYSDSNSFASLIRAFDNYGFVYSFSKTTFDGGIDKPSYYNEDYMKKLKDELTAKSVPVAPHDTPNIIYLQLESFFDVNRVIGYTFSENPVPNFEALKKEFPSGLFTVPSLGGGTANTEFEALTSMSMDYFGAGQYPYKTIMKKTTGESICYDLKKEGYSTHAIHDHTGTFYDRNVVYPNLGFDTFTPLEYMYNLEFTPKGWAKDKVLTDEIMKALKSTDGKDFIHTVSVQGHGEYPNEKIEGVPQPITMTGIADQSTLIGYEYYINELKEMDDFIGNLTETLKNFDEPVVLVMWGDHLPTFPITNEQLSSGNIYQTDYVIWSNYGLKAEHKDICAYQVTPYVMSLIGLNDGWLTKLHQDDANELDFTDKYKAMQYDMLYGKNYLMDGVKYQPAAMKMGIDKIAVNNVFTQDETFHVQGSNFNKFSVITVDGVQYDTELVGSNELIALDVDVHEGSEVTVVQKKATVLGSTEPYIYHITAK